MLNILVGAGFTCWRCTTASSAAWAVPTNPRLRQLVAAVEPVGLEAVGAQQAQGEQAEK